MTEAILKGALVKEVRLRLPNYVTFRHEDKLTSGIPDISTTGNHKTSWIEVKFANPDFKSKGIQELTMLRLDLVSSAFYVVYSQLKDGPQWTYIVSPREISKPIINWRIPPFRGFAHREICDYIEERHNDNNRT